MAKTLFDIVSVNRLRTRARNPGPTDAFGILAKTVLETLNARGSGDAENVFLNTMRDYFYNLSASAKRRHADAIAIAFCDERNQFNELWGYLKEKGVTGTTYTKRRRPT